MGLDPVLVLMETDWKRRAIRSAAYIVAARDDEARAKAQADANKR